MSRKNMPELIASILCTRGMVTDQELDHFFNPTLDHIHSPFLFKDMEKAVERILDGVGASEKICIYGDYDVDGITSLSLVKLFLRELSIVADYYIPNRLEEGYGLSEQGIRHIKESGATLLITVDCGITALKEVALANELGMDVILTDHHLPLETLPEAYAILNPRVLSCGYPDASLAGVGVAFKLVQGLSETLYPDPSHPKRQDVYKYLDLVSIGTTADIVPLVGENRILVKQGFDRLKRSSCEGVKALLNAAGLYEKTINTTQVLFQIAPLINAVGRLGDPRQCVEFFTTDDPTKASTIASELKKNNTERKGLDQSITEECFARIESTIDFNQTRFIVLASNQWHAGVVGIVASRVVEKYGRPTMILCITGDSATGSARSAGGLHVFEAVQSCSELLEDFGGHHFAAGVSLHKDHIPDLTRRLNDYAHQHLKSEDLVRKIKTDATVKKLDEIDWSVIEWLRRFEPHGPENLKPILFAEGLFSSGEARIVGNNHLKFKVSSGKNNFDAIAFKKGDNLHRVKQAKGDLTLAFSPEENEWMGHKSIQLNVRGIE